MRITHDKYYGLPSDNTKQAQPRGSFFRRHRDKLVPVITSASVLAADQATKLAVSSRIAQGAEAQILNGAATVTNYHNSGVAYGLLSSLPPWSTVAGHLGFAGAFSWAYARFYKGKTAFSNAVFGVFLAGSAGNIADRLRAGAVVDFFRFNVPAIHLLNRTFTLPIAQNFNIADVAIIASALLLTLKIVSGAFDTFFPPKSAAAADASHPKC